MVYTPQWMRRPGAVGERLRISPRRCCVTHALRHAGSVYQVTIGYFADGHAGEVLISDPRIGSEIAHLAHYTAVLLSIAMQYRVPIEVMRGAVGRHTSTGVAHSVTGAVLDLVAEESAR